MVPAVAQDFDAGGVASVVGPGKLDARGGQGRRTESRGRGRRETSIIGVFAVHIEPELGADIDVAVGDGRDDKLDGVAGEVALPGRAAVP